MNKAILIKCSTKHYVMRFYLMFILSAISLSLWSQTTATPLNPPLGPNQDGGGFAFSPDGAYGIYIITEPTSGGARSLSMYSVELSSNTATRLFQGIDFFSPNFCPNGTTIFTLVDSDANGTRDAIYSVDVDGSNLTNMTPANFNNLPIVNYVIDPSGQFLIYDTCSDWPCIRNTHQITTYKMPIDCAPEVTLATPVPTMGNWSIIILALILISIGAVAGKNYEASRRLEESA